MHCVLLELVSDEVRIRGMGWLGAGAVDQLDLDREPVPGSGNTLQATAHAPEPSQTRRWEAAPAVEAPAGWAVEVVEPPTEQPASTATSAQRPAPQPRGCERFCELGSRVQGKLLQGR
jgi:hypothetical protein